eukprot:scaffold3246_cov88-Skeletonema_menzelii.AAC.3
MEKCAYEISSKGQKLCWCTKYAKKEGVCYRHGSEVKLSSSIDGAQQSPVNGGLCVRHGAEVKLCSSYEGCTNTVRSPERRCFARGMGQSYKGCTNQIVKGGVCKRHGAQPKLLMQH